LPFARWYVDRLHVGVGKRPERASVSRLALSGSPSRPLPPPLFVPYGVADGVGHHEDAVPLVRGADGGSRYAVPLRVIPARGQLAENTSKPSSQESCNVLQHNDSRSKRANDAEGVEEETGARAVEAGSVAGDGEVLAGEAAADDVDGVESPRALVRFDLRGEVSDVLPASCMGPVPFEDAVAERIDLDLPRGAPAGRALDAKLKSADPAEE
jgi:hypothetical protein